MMTFLYTDLDIISTDKREEDFIYKPKRDILTLKAP